MFDNIRKNIVVTFFLAVIFLGFSIYLASNSSFQTDNLYNKGILFQWFDIGTVFSKSVLSFVFFAVHILIGIIITTYFVEIKYNRNDQLVPLILYLIFVFITFKYIYNISQLILESYLVLIFIQFSKFGETKKTMQYFFNLGLISSVFYLMDRTILFYLPMFLILVGIYGNYGFRDFLAFVIGFAGILYIAFSLMYIGHHPIDSLEFFPNIQVKGLETKVVIPLFLLVFTLINLLISSQSIKSFLVTIRSFFVGVLIVFLFSAGLYVLHLFRYQYLLFFIVLLNPVYCNIVLKSFKKSWKKDVYILFLILTGIFLNFII